MAQKAQNSPTCGENPQALEKTADCHWTFGNPEISPKSCDWDFCPKKYILTFNSHFMSVK